MTFMSCAVNGVIKKLETVRFQAPFSSSNSNIKILTVVVYIHPHRVVFFISFRIKN